MAGRSVKIDIFSDPNIESHAANKRMISNSYSMNAVVELDSFVQRPTDRLIARMEEFADSKKPMNFSDWMQWFAFDVMGEVSFSKQFGFLEQGQDIDRTLGQIDEMLWSGIVLAELPELYDFKGDYLAKMPFVGKYEAKLGFLIDVSVSDAEESLDNTS